MFGDKLYYLYIMKVHRQHPEDKFKQLCMKGFSRITSQDYMIVSDEKFFELLKTQPDICCKKCSKK